MSASGLFDRIAASLPAVLLAGVLLNAGPRAEDINGFVRQSGHGDVAFSYTSESYGGFWLGQTRVDVPNRSDVNTNSSSIWLAYGITDDVTLIANVPWIRSDGDQSFGLTESGVQDLTVLGKYRFASIQSGSIRSDFVAGAGVRTPTQDYENDTSPVNIGDGTTDGLFRLVYQLNYRGFYASQEIGYNLRGGDAPNALCGYTELGYTYGPVTWNASYGIQDSRGGTDIGDPGFTFPSNQKDLQRIGAKVYGRVSDDFGLFGGYFWTLDGRNVGDASGWSAGLNVSF